MSFILKSAFWLGLAFLVIGPQGMDFGAASRAVSSQALAASQHFVASQIEGPDCRDVRCVASKVALVTAVSGLTKPSGVVPMQDLPDIGPVPMPRPRPERAG